MEKISGDTPETGCAPKGRQEAWIADVFAAMLRLDLSPEQFAEMKRLNQTPQYAAGSCASHNYCDANDVMAAAFKQVVGRPSDPSSDADAALWNAAWDLARERHIGKPA